MAPRYLILGASGTMGRRLYEALGPADAVATYCRRALPDGIAFDARSQRLTDSVLRGRSGLTHAFVLFGTTSIDECARHPVETSAVNVDGVCAVIDDLVERDIIPIFVSSDAVFDGTRGMWTEDDPANPVLTYGRQKRQVEQYLAGTRSPALVTRMSKVVSLEGGKGDMLHEWVEKLEAGGIILCARDQVFSPILVDDAVNALIALANGRFTGIFHVCGPRAMTRLELLQMLVERIGNHRRPDADIVSSSLEELKDILGWEEVRPVDTSMSPRKLRKAIQIDLHDMAEVCERFVARRYGGQSAGGGGIGKGAGKP